MGKIDLTKHQDAAKVLSKMLTTNELRNLLKEKTGKERTRHNVRMGCRRYLKTNGEKGIPCVQFKGEYLIYPNFDFSRHFRTLKRDETNGK